VARQKPRRPNWMPPRSRHQGRATTAPRIRRSSRAAGGSCAGVGPWGGGGGGWERPWCAAAPAAAAPARGERARGRCPAPPRPRAGGRADGARGQVAAAHARTVGVWAAAAFRPRGPLAAAAGGPAGGGGAGAAFAFPLWGPLARGLLYVEGVDEAAAAQTATATATGGHHCWSRVVLGHCRLTLVPFLLRYISLTPPLPSPLAAWVSVTRLAGAGRCDALCPCASIPATSFRSRCGGPRPRPTRRR